MSGRVGCVVVKGGRQGAAWSRCLWEAMALQSGMPMLGTEAAGLVCCHLSYILIVAEVVWGGGQGEGPKRVCLLISTPFSCDHSVLGARLLHKHLW